MQILSDDSISIDNPSNFYRFFIGIFIDISRYFHRYFSIFSSIFLDIFIDISRYFHRYFSIFSSIFLDIFIDNHRYFSIISSIFFDIFIDIYSLFSNYLLTTYILCIYTIYFEKISKNIDENSSINIQSINIGDNPIDDPIDTKCANRQSIIISIELD